MKHSKHKYSEKAQKKIGHVMEEFSEGKLHSGSGKIVTDPAQAKAIGLSEARKRGYKVPAKTDVKGRSVHSVETPPGVTVTDVDFNSKEW